MPMMIVMMMKIMDNLYCEVMMMMMMIMIMMMMMMVVIVTMYVESNCNY
jgi:hypothetical protein